MKTSDFDYELPEELIAQTPLKNRSSSRLLVVDRKSGTYSDQSFVDILNFLHPGDGLVINETKVLPARIIGQKTETGGKIELLLLKDLGNDLWECLARPQKRLKIGTKINFTPENCHKTSQNAQEAMPIPNQPNDTSLLTATVEGVLEAGITHVRFSYHGIFNEILNQIGIMPLPPYIHKSLTDKSRYQTVYAKNLGSAAAPTAGLHFTPELLQKIEQKGIKIIKITLHVGLGTFRPVEVNDVEKHQMHTETFEITPEAAAEINKIKSAKGKIFAVGTTTVRTLETVAKKSSIITPDKGETDIFIYPGYKFKIVDGLITNFHLPKSTLLMLVSAFASQNSYQSEKERRAIINDEKNAKKSPDYSGRDLILRAYDHAISEKYRFFSFGDAMLII